METEQSRNPQEQNANPEPGRQKIERPENTMKEGELHRGDDLPEGEPKRDGKGKETFPAEGEKVMSVPNVFSDRTGMTQSENI